MGQLNQLFLEPFSEEYLERKRKLNEVLDRARSRISEDVTQYRKEYMAHEVAHWNAEQEWVRRRNEDGS